MLALVAAARPAHCPYAPSADPVANFGAALGAADALLAVRPLWSPDHGERVVSE